MDNHGECGGILTVGHVSAYFKLMMSKTAKGLNDGSAIMVMSIFNESRVDTPMTECARKVSQNRLYGLILLELREQSQMDKARLLILEVVAAIELLCSLQVLGTVLFGRLVSHRGLDYLCTTLFR